MTLAFCIPLEIMATAESPSVKRKRVDASSSSNGQGPSKSGYALKIIRRQYLDEKTADVFFICGPANVRVPAHKSVLSKASDAFDGMFYGPIAEKGDVKLPKTSPDAFKDFLQFCYLDEIDLNLEHIVGIMDLTNKYCMPECLVLCGRFWAKHLTIDDLCLAYHWAIFYEEKELIGFCERKISACPQVVFESSSFLRCEYIVFDHILTLDSLLCDETIVLSACLDWARHACERDGQDSSQLHNLRVYLKDSLHKIRYGSMTLNEFREHMDANGGLFTEVKEYEDVIRLLSGSKDLKTGRFNPNPRSLNIFQWNENEALEYQMDSPDKSIFLSNQPILLGGFYCAPFLERHTTEMKMTITQEPKVNSDDKSKSLVIMSETVTSYPTGKTYIECTDEHPIIIRPEFKYRVRLEPVKILATGHGITFGGFNYIESGLANNRIPSETTIQFPQGGTSNEHPVIKCFKFNRL